MKAQSVQFAEAVRTLGDCTRAAGLSVPGFRSPPKVVGYGRTMRRRPDGSVVVAVAIKNRPWAAVVSDMIEGIVLANGLTGVDAARIRDDLWSASGMDVRAAA